MQKRNNPNFIFWFNKGDGMLRRSHNINMVKRMIQFGLNYQEIIRKLRKYFKSKTINEYYDIALDEVNNPLENSIVRNINEIRREEEGKK